jgi:hypothetical protein
MSGTDWAFAGLITLCAVDTVIHPLLPTLTVVGPYACLELLHEPSHS